MVLPLRVEGQGVPGVGFILGDVLPLLPWLLGVDGLELDDPGFGAESEDPFALPGKVPQGELLGDVPGVFVVFGVPLGEVEPGVWPGVVCGVAVPAGGVAVPAGGVAVFAGGVAGEPGVEL